METGERKIFNNQQEFQADLVNSIFDEDSLYITNFWDSKIEGKVFTRHD